jgi:hypothetical protein
MNDYPKPPFAKQQPMPVVDPMLGDALETYGRSRKSASTMSRMAPMAAAFAQPGRSARAGRS